MRGEFQRVLMVGQGSSSIQKLCYPVVLLKSLNIYLELIVNRLYVEWVGSRQSDTCYSDLRRLQTSMIGRQFDQCNQIMIVANISVNWYMLILCLIFFWLRAVKIPSIMTTLAFVFYSCPTLGDWAHAPLPSSLSSLQQL